MKIFLAFQQSDKTHPIPAYGFWEHYIKNGIVEAGQKWVECAGVDWALGLVPKGKTEQAKWKDHAWSKTLAYLKKHPVDLFLGYLYPEQINSSAIGEIKKMGIPCVNFFCDNIREFTRPPAEFGVFDLNWVPEYKAVAAYKKAGYPHINLPMPMWIAPELRKFNDENNTQVTFIGSRDIQRQLLFERVVAKSPQIYLAIYGYGWKDGGPVDEVPATEYTIGKKISFQYQFAKKNGLAAYLRKIEQRNILSEIREALQLNINGQINFDDYNKLTTRSMITLGVNRYPSYRYPLSKPNSYSRLRDIEAPMLGACYLTEWTDGLDELYDIETEITVYRNADDLIEQVSALQSDPEKRRTLRINGQKRALQDHSIPQSLKRIALNL